jgi:dienelactone hydrolase
MLIGTDAGSAVLTDEEQVLAFARSRRTSRSARPRRRYVAGMPEIITHHIPYEHDGVALDGVLVSEESPADHRRPVVLVVHGMEGRSDAQVDFATRLAEWGYAGFAVDLFGVEATAAGLDRCGELMNAYLADRSALRHRLLHVLDVVRSLPGVDPDRVAATGFCFGGLCVLDIARSGADVRAVASFHGVLTAPPDGPTGPIPSKVIVFHGWDDPFAPPADVVGLGAELTERGADWQIHAYGNTMHAFMAPMANNPDAGILYNETSARRTWESLRAFLAESLDPTG